MSILLLSCAFLAGMVVTALIYAWDARIKNRRKRDLLPEFYVGINRRFEFAHIKRETWNGEWMRHKFYLGWLLIEIWTSL